MKNDFESFYPNAVDVSRRRGRRQLCGAAAPASLTPTWDVFMRLQLLEKRSRVADAELAARRA